MPYAMKKKDIAEVPKNGIAIARARFCWETEANSGRVLHYYGDRDGNRTSYPTQQKTETLTKKNKK